MKKTICVLIACLLACLCAVPAFADMGGPSFLTYEAYVSNPDGAVSVNFYDDAGYEEVTLRYMRKVTVEDEYRRKDVLYVCVNLSQGEYGRDEYFFRAADFSKNKAKVDANAGVKLDDATTYIVIDPNGTALRDGPAESYAAIETIPAGTVLTALYGSESYHPEWAYVTYGDSSGWVYVYSNADFRKDTQNYGCAEQLKQAVTLQVMDARYPLRELPDYESKTLTKPLPVDTKLSSKYAYNEDWYYVEYQGVKGWIPDLYYNYDSIFGLARNDDELMAVMCSSGVKLYERPTATREQKALATIPQGQLLQSVQAVKYQHHSEEDGENIMYWDFWHRVAYRGMSGWVCESEQDEETQISTVIPPSYYDVKVGVPVYEKPDVASRMLYTIPNGQKIIGSAVWLNGRVVILAKYQDRYGWILLTDRLEERTPGTLEYSALLPKSVIDQWGMTEQTTDVPATQATTDEPTAHEVPPAAELIETTGSDAPVETIGAIPAESKTKTVLIVCLCVAGVLALTAAVILLLMKKRRAAKAVPLADSDPADATQKDETTTEDPRE